MSLASASRVRVSVWRGRVLASLNFVVSIFSVCVGRSSNGGRRCAPAISFQPVDMISVAAVWDSFSEVHLTGSLARPRIIDSPQGWRGGMWRGWLSAVLGCVLCGAHS